MKASRAESLLAAAAAASSLVFDDKNPALRMSFETLEDSSEHQWTEVTGKHRDKAKDGAKAAGLPD
eukprot:4930509-Pyramimonas_sp.AAC.1